MGRPYQTLLRPLLFRQDPERAHDFALKTLGRISQDAGLSAMVGTLFSAPQVPTEVFGLKFPNPLGLAAGLDKHAAAVPIWEQFGFGFCELGGVTRHAQPGNPTPRMFRAVTEEAIINRMGFNNSGADAVAQKLVDWKKAGRWPGHPVGINLGKSKITPLEEAASDYAYSFRALRDLADFFVVNVSSPNTPGLRALQDKSALDDIFAALQSENPSRKPILVKVAPDLTFDAMDEILELVAPRNIAGIVATNTTIARPTTSNVAAQKTYTETGGLSGRPLRSRSTEVIRHLYRQTRGQVPIIGVGGIFTGADAWEKLAAGASLLQLYSGLVYEGPGVARAIVRDLQKRMTQAGVRNLTEVIGAAN